MVYYSAYREKIHTGIWYGDLIVGFFICVIVGILFYFVEKRITRIVIEIFNKTLNKYLFERSKMGKGFS